MLLELFASFLSPPRCAACDAPVALRTAFCAACAVTLVRAGDPEAAFEYGGALERAIHRFKYEDRPDLARPLGAALARLPLPPDALGVIPVPLHPRRLAERGYNQSALLARALALPLRADILFRVRDTPRQAELDLAARRSNVEGAFACRRSAEGAWLLVDDVRTTGSTLRACARALRASGARVVRCAVLAVKV